MEPELALLLQTPAFLGVAFAFGLIVGSFANVCIYRIPRGLSVVTPRSRCPRCARPISSLENIPLLSWLVLRRRCRAWRGVRRPN